MSMPLPRRTIIRTDRQEPDKPAYYCRVWKGKLCLSIPVPHLHIKNSMWGEIMERVVMPEIITPALTEIISSRPEILDQLLGNNNNEEIICGKDMEFDSENMPKVLKFLFCNIRIIIGDISHEAAREAAENENEAGGSLPFRADIRLIIERLKKLGQQLDEKNRQVGIMLSDVVAMKEKLLILETRIKDDRRALKLVASDSGYRKLAYNYKMDIKALLVSLDNERYAFATVLNNFEHEKEALDSLDEEIRKMNGLLYERLIKGQ